MSRAEALVATAVTVAVLAAVLANASPLLRGPAPYPPEWQWGLEPKATWDRLGPALLCLAGLLALIAVAGRTRRHGALLAAATLLGAGLQVALLGLETGGAVAELVRRTASGSFTSYHTVAAAGPGRDPGRFLARHHEILPGLRKGTLHAATHPPGAVLFYRGLIDLAERSPRLRSLAGAIIGRVDPDPAPGLTPAARAAALLGPVLLGLLGAAACWPVRALAFALTDDGLASVRIGVLWTLVPGLVLMAPEVDQALALPVGGAAAAFAVAVRTTAPARATRAALLAGLLAGLAAFFSYGAVVLAGVAWVACLTQAAGGAPWRRQAGRAVLLAAASATAVVLLPMLFGHDPFRSAVVALSIHRDQFTTPRGYGTWLLFNAWDLFLFLGPSVAALGLWRAARALVASRSEPPLRADAFRAALLGALVAFLLTGAVRGEAGRILVPLMPVLLAGALAGPGSPGGAVGALLAVLLFAVDVVLRMTWRLP
jgi:hypothetical protein